MKNKILTLALLAGATLAPMQASATAITTLYNTGVNGSGATVAGLNDDSHWVWSATLGGSSQAAITQTTATGTPGAWMGNDSISDWITPSGTISQAAGDYFYTTTFSLTGLNPSTASISGGVAADDQVLQVYLNGVSLGLSPFGGFPALTPFTITSGFVAGTNSLTFEVVNAIASPTGLRVEMSGTAAAVPETATWAMMLAGFAMVGVAMRRRNTAFRVTYA